MSTIDMEQTGRKIEYLRNKNGYSVRDLQKAMDPISIQAIYKWERGLSVPSIDNLILLSDIFHIPIDQIVMRDA